MKAFILSLVASSFLFFGLPAMAAEKITITGDPVVIMEEDGVYVPTTPVTTSDTYYYFTVDGTNMVCYQEVNPALVGLNTNTFLVKIGEESVSLYCYEDNPDYFIIQ